MCVTTDLYVIIRFRRTRARQSVRKLSRTLSRRFVSVNTAGGGPSNIRAVPSVPGPQGPRLGFSGGDFVLSKTIVGSAAGDPFFPCNEIYCGRRHVTLSVYLFFFLFFCFFAFSLFHFFRVARSKSATSDPTVASESFSGHITPPVQ